MILVWTLNWYTTGRLVDELVERAVRTGMAGQSAESMSSADEGRLDRQPQEMPAWRVQLVIVQKTMKNVIPFQVLLSPVLNVLLSVLKCPIPCFSLPFLVYSC